MSTSIQNMPTVSLSKAPSLLRLAANMKRSIVMWGEPGVGKSGVVRKFASDIGAVLVDVRLSQYDAVDLRGLPDDDGNGNTAWLRPSTMPFEGNPAFDVEGDERPIVLFLDELLHAKADVQAVGFQILHTDDRCVGEHKLLDRVIVVAASNRETDRAGVHKMLTPVANRCMHMNVESSTDAWKQWAATDGEIEPVVIGYINFRGDHLSQFAEALKTSAKAFPTPRAWETVSRIITECGKETGLRELAIAATIGEGVATEFNAFVRMAEKAPTFDDIVADPKKARVPVERDMMCAVSAMLCRRVDIKTIDTVIDYIDRMPEEYQTVFCADLAQTKSDLIVQSEKLLDKMAKLGSDVFSD